MKPFISRQKVIRQQNWINLKCKRKRHSFCVVVAVVKTILDYSNFNRKKQSWNAVFFRKTQIFEKQTISLNKAFLLLSLVQNFSLLLSLNCFSWTVISISTLKTGSSSPIPSDVLNNRHPSPSRQRLGYCWRDNWKHLNHIL